MVGVSAFDKDADIHVLRHLTPDHVYYTIVEVVPSALVLFILIKLTPKQMSDHYHPLKWSQELVGTMPFLPFIWLLLLTVQMSIVHSCVLLLIENKILIIICMSY